MDIGGNSVVKVWGHLSKDVVEPDYCIGCGSCVATCPVQVLERVNERPTLKGACINCGICYGTCPEVVDSKSLQVPVFGAAASDELLGTYVQALSVETNDSNIKVRAQDGGAVTTILGSLLENGYIDAAIVTGTKEAPWQPVAMVVTTANELIECAGTKYSRGPISLGLWEAVNMYYRGKIAVVGTPCQIVATRRMGLSKPKNEHISDAIKLRIGLFCSGVFKYQTFFKDIIEKDLQISLADVAKFDMKGDKFIICMKNQPSREIPLSTVKQHVDTPCKICSDFSAEMADISVGYAGSPAGRSTVLVRTQVGVQALEIATRLQRFSAVDLAGISPGIEALRQDARAKKDAAANAMEVLRKNGKVLPIWMQEIKPEVPGEPIESDKGICLI